MPETQKSIASFSGWSFAEAKKLLSSAQNINSTSAKQIIGAKQKQHFLFFLHLLSREMWCSNRGTSNQKKARRVDVEGQTIRRVMGT